MVVSIKDGRTWKNGSELTYTLPHIIFKRTSFVESLRWSENNLEGEMDYNKVGFLFEYESDMILFKLRWA